MEAPVKLTLGPLLFNWPEERRRDFYFRVADEAPFDTVYLGEVVCAKRLALFGDDMDEVASRLRRAGKEVVFSTLALVMSPREEAATHALAAETDILVEANDLAAIRHLAGRRHVIGPFVNVYNEDALDHLRRRGASRFVLPAELPARAIAALAAGKGGAEIEAQAFGRLPLALSARCHHARSHGLHRDGCQYVCAEDPDGLTVETLEGTPFLAVNGTQTLSHAYCSLLAEADILAAMGVDRMRLWPHDIDMVTVARLFRDRLDGRLAIDEAEARLVRLIGGAPLANGFFHGREGAGRVAAGPINNP